MNKKIRTFGIGMITVLWLILAIFAWVTPAKDISQSERRPLTQFPALDADTLLSGKFMSGFEEYAVDQFPVRDTFRQVKSLFHYYVLGQKDNNGIYVKDGYAVKQEYPEDPESIRHATDRFRYVYEKYLEQTESKIYAAVIPDKNYYLAEESGHLALNYPDLFAQVEEQMPYAEHIDLTGSLNQTSYYYTDTHWRQESLLPVAQTLCNAMDMPAPDVAEFTATKLQRPFYGVYYGQAALPLQPEDMYILESQRLNACRVYDFETGEYGEVYDLQKLDSKDIYDVFLSGAKSLLRIENPNAETDRELIIFRDSFGSAVAPLLVSEYKTVILIDIRYISSELLDRYIKFKGQDVLFLYSASVLNNAATIK